MVKYLLLILKVIKKLRKMNDNMSNSKKKKPNRNGAKEGEIKVLKYSKGEARAVPKNKNRSVKWIHKG